MTIQKNREVISIARADKFEEGEHLVTVEDLELLAEKRQVIINNKQQKRKIIRAKFRFKNGKSRNKDMIFTLTENSELGLFIKSVKGYLPDQIADLGAEVLGKELVVEIAKNIKDNKTYYNIVSFKNRLEYKPVKQESSPRNSSREHPMSSILGKSKSPLRPLETK